MTDKTLRLAKVRLEAIRKTLSGTPTGEKKNRISKSTAADFNSIRQQIITAHPEAISAIPAEITSENVMARHFPIADMTFLDFELAIEQTIAIVDALDS